MSHSFLSPSPRAFSLLSKSFQKAPWEFRNKNKPERKTGDKELPKHLSQFHCKKIQGSFHLGTILYPVTRCWCECVQNTDGASSAADVHRDHTMKMKRRGGKKNKNDRTREVGRRRRFDNQDIESGLHDRQRCLCVSEWQTRAKTCPEVLAVTDSRRGRYRHSSITTAGRDR